MSAVRMVAYGVLEMKHKDGAVLFLELLTPAEQERKKQEDHERDQLRKLVNDELKRYGLLMVRNVAPKGERYRTSFNTFILLGQRRGPKGFETREELTRGSFKECCEVATKLLDYLDASQVPDTATGV